MKAWHDVHIHNYLSSCSGDNQATVENYIKAAREIGLKLMGFANHTWDESVPLPAASGFYKKQSLAFQLQIKQQITEQSDLKILVGAETEYCGMYDVLGMSREGAKQLDFLLIPHTHVHMRDFVMPATEDVKAARAKLADVFGQIEGITPERAASLAKKLPEAELEPFMDEKKVDYIQFVADFMVESFRGLMNNEMLKTYSNEVPVSVAHPFQPVGSYGLRLDMLRRIDDNTYGELFTAAAQRGIGLEINSATNFPEVLHFFSIAKECGCKFTLGSDLHATADFPKITATEATMEALGLTEYDFMDFVRISLFA